MNPLLRRLDRLEAAHGSDKRPVILWEDAPAPADADDRPIVRVRWMTEAEATERA
jgi:hypothetical protein